ncbi:twin-arginine translocase TatA/TatE family subunit [Salana multivorans]
MRLTWAHLLVLLLVVLLLFGARRLPDVARNVGQSLKIMKKEVRDLRDDPEDPATDGARDPDLPKR